MTLPLAITMGEPAGIGLDIIIAAWKQRTGPRPFYVIAPPAVLLRRAALLGVTLKTRTIADPAEAPDVFSTALPILPIDGAFEVTPGRPSVETAPAVCASIELAVDHALSAKAGGVVTAPISKKVLSEAGFLYPGHTEYLAALCRNKGHAFDGPVMMLAARGLRVVPVTIHTPLKTVPGLLTIDLVVNTAEVVMQALKTDFGVTHPRLAVAGLNPHAGEDGMLGDEEETIITPAVTRLRNRNYTISGPSAADSLFHEAARQEYDAALCMYHDQALIPLKTVDFWGGVNITLGLPIVRTSPDHGTAFALAGSGKANADSMIAAIEAAGEISANRLKAAG
jgi:4-hydroxythreonine-4-phosphate dehydrogenase